MIKKIIAFSCIFSSIAFADEWLIDIPHKEAEKVYKSFNSVFPIKDSKNLLTLNKLIGFDVSSKKELSSFIGDNIDLIKLSGSSNVLCEKKGRNCFNKISMKNSSFTIPISGGNLWAPFFDYKNSTPNNDFIKMSGNGSIKVNKGMMIYSIEEDENYPFPSYGLLKLFSAALLSNNIKQGIEPLRVCDAVGISYLCENKGSNYFLTTSRFIELIKSSCKSCNGHQLLFIDYLKYSNLMRTNEKEIINKSYGFFTRNKKNLKEIGLEFTLENKIYLSFFLNK